MDSKLLLGLQPSRQLIQNGNLTSTGSIYCLQTKNLAINSVYIEELYPQSVQKLEKALVTLEILLGSLDSHMVCLSSFTHATSFEKEVYTSNPKFNCDCECYINQRIFMGNKDMYGLESIHLGNQGSHIYDSSTLGSITGNTTFLSFTLIIYVSQSSQNNYLGSPVACDQSHIMQVQHSPKLE